jgi:hypothetical protein
MRFMISSGTTVFDRIPEQNVEDYNARTRSKKKQEQAEHKRIHAVLTQMCYAHKYADPAERAAKPFGESEPSRMPRPVGNIDQTVAVRYDCGKHVVSPPNFW